MQLSYVRVLVDNFSDCLRFYKDVLGLETLWSDEKNYAEFKAGGDSRIAIFRRDLAQQALGIAGDAGNARRFMIVLAVANVDETVAAIEARGGKALAAAVDRPDWTVRTAHFADPEGNIVEVNSPLK